MSLLLDPEFWARLASIVIIDLSLAGDNALVIALAVRSLAPREQWLGRVWGTAAAVGLRLLFIAVVSALLAIPLLQAGAGRGTSGTGPRCGRRSGSSWWPTSR